MAANRPAKKRKNRPARNDQPKGTTSMLEGLGDDMVQKLKRHVEDNIKKKIREAQADPKVVAASEKFADK
jgi:hypothetical protein